MLLVRLGMSTVFASPLAIAALVANVATSSAVPQPEEPGPRSVTADQPAATAVPPPPSQIGNPLALAGAEQGPAGIPTSLSITGDTALIGQHIAPAAPGSNGPVIAPGPNALNNQYLLPQNLKPSAPGGGEIYEVAPGGENADVAGADYLRRLWHQYQNGDLKGGLLGRRPKEELNQPIPDTAPPQGTRIPGLGDDSHGPAPEQWHWTPPDQPEVQPALPTLTAPDQTHLTQPNPLA